MTSPVVIVGSGFAGTILARLLAARGRSAMLVERGTHPRFALGESSTPLAAICLERLARAYGLEDLADLAAYGRWMRSLPGVRRGLKRGFTFYGHERGRPYENDEHNRRRLLVAASPDDEVADAHWVRSDVDAWLVARAVSEGVELVDRCELESVEGAPGTWSLRGTRDGRSIRLEAGFVVDASGAGGFLARDVRFGAGPAPLPSAPATGLVYGHFAGVGSFVEIAETGGAMLAGAPYPEERAAVHHLLDEGWMYVLPFDDGVVSAGIVVDRAHADAGRLLAADPDDAWRGLLASYPTIASQFADARPVEPVRTVRRLQRRARRASGEGWALLPHSFAFSSPMFSTGIAWSLLGVERLARILDPVAPSPERSLGLARYDVLLALEADAIHSLVAPAYRLRADFDAFAAWSHVYFAAASWTETLQRLTAPPPPGEWSDLGFLGADDPVLHRAREQAAASPLLDVVGRLIAPRNVAGLADPGRHRVYPVDLDDLVEAHHRIGLTRDETIAALPRLRGGRAPLSR